jgi:hypothetical protein
MGGCTAAWDLLSLDEPRASALEFPPQSRGGWPRPASRRGASLIPPSLPSKGVPRGKEHDVQGLPAWFVQVAHITNAARNKLSTDDYPKRVMMSIGAHRD